MPSTLKPYTPRCLCGKPATHQVYDRLNNYRGMWCKPCGTQYVRELDAKEKAETVKPKSKTG